MCGIAGFFGPLAAKPEAQALLTSMTRMLEHRGPDGQGTWLGPDVGLGHTRLAIIDTEGGIQPMTSADGRYIIVFNGEIYNFQELKKDLEASGYRFLTRSDTEVIPAAIDAWGPDRGLRSLRGMFGFALYDTRNHTLLIARDRVGIKPVFWAESKGSILFGSEPKAMLETGLVSHRIDPVAIHDYLAYGYASTPATCWAGIRQLEPGSWMQFSAAGQKSGRYWQWEPKETFTGGISQATELLKDTLGNAVRSHLISDVPVGTFLSGGLDSSLITALLGPELAAKTDSFSVGFGDRKYDESEAARIVANHCGTRHHELRMEAGTGNPELLRTVLEQYDEPFADSSAIPTYLLCREVRKHVKVVLSGDGGDEVLGGYVRYLTARRVAALEPVKNILGWFEPVINFGEGRWGKAGLKASRVLAMSRMDVAERVSYAHMYFSEDHRASLYHPEFAPSALASGGTLSRLAPLVPNGGTHPVHQMIAAEMSLRLHADYLRKVDVASSAHGLEVRVPFLDNQMLDLAASLPVSMKLSVGGDTKILARRLVKQLLPPAIAKKKKQGFSIPVDTWAGKEMRTYLHDLLLGSQSYIKDVLHRPAIKQVWDDFETPVSASGLSRDVRYQRVFLLAAIEIWMRRWKPA